MTDRRFAGIVRLAGKDAAPGGRNKEYQGGRYCEYSEYNEEVINNVIYDLFADREAWFISC